MNNNLEEIFQKENLIVPNYNNINIVNLMQALFNRYGGNFEINENIKKLNNIIPKTKHTLFILIDGMGSNLVSSLEDNFVIKTNKKMDLLTVSPSTTGCVLTSVATGTYPSNHGVIGWYSYNREHKIDYYPLLFADRKNKKSLKNFNISPSDIYKVESMFNKLNTKTKVIYPKYICDSVYSNFVADSDKRVAYDNYSDIVKIMNEITTSSDDTFTYLYLSEIDNLEHDNGVYSQIVKEELSKIDSMIKELLKIKDLSVVITADHGQIDIKDDVIMDFNKYKKYFYAMPGIDFATTTFYVKEDKQKEFKEEFEKDFKDKMFLFDTSTFYEKNVFGPELPSEYLRSNMGEYIGICRNGYSFINSENIDEYLGNTKGNHSGFSKDEMIIPLIIINSNDY